MIPILYDSTETAFTSQGLGCLTDAISCEVTEERNGEFELELEYPISGIHYGDIAYSRYIAAVPADGEDAQPFEIYKITRPLDGVVTVYARHLSYRLGYTPVRPTTAATSAASALSTLKSAAVVPCPFTFSSDVTKAGTFTNSKLQSLRSLLGGQTGSILDVFGGEYKFDKWNVSLLSSRGSSIPVTIEYGKNLTDLKQEENIESTYTAVICTWQKEVDGVTTTQTGDIVYTENKDAFPYVRTLVVEKSMDYDTQPTIAQLTADATSYIKANNVGVPNVSIDVSFVNLRDTEEYKNVAPLQRIHLCDTIKVKFSKLGVNASAKITKTVYDTLSERYKSLTIGDARSSLAGTVVGITEEIDTKTKQASSAMQTEMERITKVIQGGLGGYVVQRMNESTGYPEETLYLDQPDLDTAQTVLRINKNGIAFSTNGYKGPYSNAWLIDGTLIADWIKAGIISDVAKKNYWNMETGEFSLQSSATVGGKTVSQIAQSAVDAQTQTSIFNKLTNNGVTQGIYLSNGKVYINGTYIRTGTITGANGKIQIDLNSETVKLLKGAGFEIYDPNGVKRIALNNGAAGWGLYAPVFDGKEAYFNGGSGSEDAGYRVYINKSIDGNTWGVSLAQLNFFTTKDGAYCGYMYGSSENTITMVCGVDEDGDGSPDGHFTLIGRFNNYSDRNLKHDIEDISDRDAMDFVMSLRPRAYRFNGKRNEQSYGFIAQEVQEHLPDHGGLVWSSTLESKNGTSKKTYLTLAYLEIIPFLTSVIQQQERRILSMEERLNSLEERFNADN